VESQTIPVLAEPLQRHPANPINADVYCSDGVPRLLGGGLVSEVSSQLSRNSGEDSLERPQVIVEVDNAVLDGVPELSGLHLDLN
jgi:hypothetical protein